MHLLASALIFLSVDVWVQKLSTLANLWQLMVVGLSSCTLYFFIKRYWSYAYLILIAGIAFIYCNAYSHYQLRWELPKCWENQALIARGEIKSLPMNEGKQTTFIFKLQKLVWPQAKNILTMTPRVDIRLSWREPTTTLKVGQSWQWVVKLKRVHGLHNPQSFDYEAWALQQGVRALGYVQIKNPPKLIAYRPSHYPLEAMREWLYLALQKVMPHTPGAHWLYALTLGLHHQIPTHDWQVLKNTGTNHLMAIAGLHIGVIAGLTHWLIKKCLQKLPHLLFYQPANHFSAGMALIIAIFYSALAGFSIPTERACMMLVAIVIHLFLRRFTSPWQCWSFALIIVLMLNPLDVLTESFWLSFGTIALIIFGMKGRLAPSGWWWRWGRVQWIIGMGLMPLTLLFFQQASIVSFIANCIAIPWLSFLILPFCFFALPWLAIYPPFAKCLLFIAGQSLSILWILLSWVSSLPIAVWHQTLPSAWLCAALIIGVIGCLLPKGFPAKWLAMVWVLPTIFYDFPRPKPNAYWLTVLDVGQGLSVVVQTAHHTLIYDAGPKFEQYNAGESVIIPFLHSQNIKVIDKLIISHADNDHRGGALALLTKNYVKKLQTSVPAKFIPWRSEYCLAGKEWWWDGVHFKFLYPDEDHLHLGNNSSCVLQIVQRDHTSLLTGDIESYAEDFLLKASINLKATVLIAPHHGSKTSSTAPWVAKVAPQHVVYAVGYQNRYHFPHAIVESRYMSLGAKHFNTSIDGGITIQMAENKNPMIVTYKNQYPHYWYR